MQAVVEAVSRRALPPSKGEHQQLSAAGPKHDGTNKQAQAGCCDVGSEAVEIGSKVGSGADAAGDRKMPPDIEDERGGEAVEIGDEGSLVGSSESRMGFGSGRAMSHDSVGEDMEGMGDREETEESGVDVKTEGGEAHKSSDIVFHKSCMSMAERHRARCECISVRVLAYMLTRACVCCLSVFLSFMHMLSFRCACVVLSV